MTYCTRGPRCSFVQKKERARMISEAEKGSIVRLSTMLENVVKKVSFRNLNK